MAKFYNVIVILCGIVGMIFIVVGLSRFPEWGLGFIILFLGCLIALLLSSKDLLKSKNNIEDESKNLILPTLSGVVLVLASLFIIFFTSYNLLMKFIATLSTIFFSIAVVKGSILLFKRN